ncbi:MAG TPA: RDD family protein [Bacillota bacterium]|nr:RDD family protein [Bacillota bacterium]HPJ24410.1 RDD family protein [Bacillota bacterium]
MTVGFFKRLTSAIVDLVLICLVLYLAYVLGVRTILQNRVEYFDQRYDVYMQILDAYSNDMTDLQTEYNANVTLANGDADLEAAALDLYNSKVELLKYQNAVDIEPYNEALTGYFLEIIYYFAIGLVILATFLTSLTAGKTPGRKVARIKLQVVNKNGEFKDPTPIQVFIHDVILKYFLILIVFTLNMFYGVMLLLISVITDLILISISRNKTTVRDSIMHMKVIQSN